MSDVTNIAIISAGAALSGVLLSSIVALLVAWQSRRHERQKVLAEKYEAVMLYFTDSFGWFVAVNSSRTREELFSHSQNDDARKALALCLIYFPELVDVANGYVLSMARYYSYIMDIYDPRIPSNAGGQVVAGGGEIEMNKIADKKSEFENAMHENAHRYTAV
jgi:hypothetical protein